MDKATAAADSFDKSMDAAGNSAKEAVDQTADSESGFSKLSSTPGTGLVKSADL